MDEWEIIRCILLYVGLCFLKVPLTTSYTFDSGTAFCILIVGPHMGKIYLCEFISDFWRDLCVCQKGQL